MKKYKFVYGDWLEHEWLWIRKFMEKDGYCKNVKGFGNLNKLIKTAQ